MEKRIISQIISGIVIVTAIIVMIGWIFNIPVLKSILPTWVTMKFITAISFLLSGVLIFLISKKEKKSFSDSLIVILSFSLLLLMATFLASFFFGIHTGIENLFVKEMSNAVKTTIPGVPAIPTMICFVLIAFSGIIFLFNQKDSLLKFWIGMMLSVIGGMAILGYLFQISILYYDILNYTPMAFHTAILFFLIGIALIFNKEVEKNETTK